MSGIITFQLCLISHIWIIFVLLKICHGQITNSHCESSRSHSNNRSHQRLSPNGFWGRPVKSETESRKMSERRPSWTRQRLSGMSAMFFLPPTPFLLHLSSFLSLHPRLDSSQLFLSNVTPTKTQTRRSENRKFPSSLSSSDSQPLSDTWVKSSKVGPSSRSHKLLGPVCEFWLEVKIIKVKFGLKSSWTCSVDLKTCLLKIYCLKNSFFL